ncbi:hypothetical protein FACS189418_8240 [Clostridia bacterium]|nr:hypothetical protein FACS189418_8240 [Clostridia bacterium]
MKILIEQKKVRRFVILGMILSVFLLIFGWVQSKRRNYLQDGYAVLRPEQKVGEQTYRVEARTQKKGKKTVEILVQPRQYSQEELEELFSQTAQNLPKEVLGKNQSWEKLEYPLSLESTTTEEGIDILWKSEQMDRIQRKEEQEILKEGESIELTLILSCQDQEREYLIQGKIFDPELNFWEKLKKSLIDQQEEKRRAVFDLPKEIDGEMVFYSYPLDGYPFFLGFVGILCTIFMVLAYQSQIKEKQKKKAEQMLLDYPEILFKFGILFDCGMTVKKAWFKLANDYQKTLQEKKQGVRYAYEEICKSAKMMENGAMEKDVYRQFALSCSLIPYRKLATLLEQNVSKGNRSLKQIFDQEIDQAFEQKMNVSKKQGEEASIKLLLPMSCIFILILLIICIPSIFLFSGV